MAAISYDGAALLKDFAARKKLTYTLLSDPDSRVIRAFGILNPNFPPGHPAHGVPYPGTFFIDEHGVVTAKYFEDDHRDRYTAAAMLFRHFGAARGIDAASAEERHLKAAWWASDAAAYPGGVTTLVLEIELGPGMHVYAPGVTGGYIAVEWKMEPTHGWVAGPASWPASRKLRLPVINETVPVYERSVRILRDLTLGQEDDLKPFMGPDRTITVAGSFRYQACDDRECYAPESMPLKWTFHVEHLDGQRAPEQYRRKSGP